MLENVFVNQFNYHELAYKIGIKPSEISEYESCVVVTRCDSRKFCWHHTLTAGEFDVLLKKMRNINRYDFEIVISSILTTNIILIHLTDNAKMLSDINYQIASRIITRLEKDVHEIDNPEEFRRRRIRAFMGIAAFYSYARRIAGQAICYLRSVKDPLIFGMDILYRRLTDRRDESAVEVIEGVMSKFISATFIYEMQYKNYKIERARNNEKPDKNEFKHIYELSSSASKAITGLPCDWTLQELEAVEKKIDEFSDAVMKKMVGQRQDIIVDDGFVENNDI